MANYNDDARRRRRGEDTDYDIGMPDPGALDAAAIDSAFDRTSPPASPNRETPDFTTQPVKDAAPSSIPEPVTPAAKPALPPGSSASARYGTGNIPGAEGLAYGDTSRLKGFNTNEWGPGGTEGYEDSSIKNTFGKIATRYPSSPDGLRQLMADPDFLQYFPEARILDHPTDPKIDFGDGNPIDVLAASGEQGWQWLPEDEAGAPVGAGGGAGVGGGAAMPTGLGDDSDVLAQIQAALAAQSRGEMPFLNQKLEGMV